MDELNPNARTLLDEARAASSPSAADVSALRDRLGLLTPPPPPATAPEPPSGQTTLVRRLVVGGVAVAAVVAAIVAATASSPEVSRLQPLATFAPQRTPAPTRETPQPSPAQPEPSPSAELSPPSAPAAPPPSRSSAKRGPDKKRAQRRGDLQDQLALIVHARKALAAGNDAGAKKSAQRYTRTFPGGAFQEEAEVLTFIASCNLGGTAATRKRARSYVERGTPSFAQRVRKACLEPRD